jgi:hypothetical protein
MPGTGEEAKAENKDGKSAGENKPDEGDKSKGGTPLEFDAWIKDQPAEVKTLLEGHEGGLKTALTSERENRKKLEKDLRELAGKADKGSDAEKKLTEMADQVSESDRRAEFYEEAHAAGVTNLKLAYLVAQTDELFDKRGRVNFETVKGSYPELFGGKPKPPKGNAGEGSEGKEQPITMDDMIRKKAGSNRIS